MLNNSQLSMDSLAYGAPFYEPQGHHSLLDVPILNELLQSSIKLSAEKDVDRLLDLFMHQAQQISDADLAMLYRVHDNRLTFHQLRCLSLDIELDLYTQSFIQVHSPVYQQQHDLLAMTAATGRSRRIDNIYAQNMLDVSHLKFFDQQARYQSRSLMVVPVVDSKFETLALLVLINRKPEGQGKIEGFQAEHETLVEQLAGYAAIGLENEANVSHHQDLFIRLAAAESSAELLDLIIQEAQYITNADGGTLYLLKGEEQQRRLEFAIIRNNSLGIHFNRILDSEHRYQDLQLFNEEGRGNHNNIASHTALTKQVVNIQDAYDDIDFDFSGVQRFDKQFGYRSKSFLCVPLLNHDADVIGVLQLVNALDIASAEVKNFDRALEPIIAALGHYAALTLNRQMLIEDQKKLLDSFIQCIARVIDVKSSHTSGHCQRVPAIMELIASAACQSHEQPFADFQLDADQWYELRVASWLHDCGKLATPDYLIDKSTKLKKPFDRIELIKARFSALKQETQNRFLNAIISRPQQQQSLKQALQQKLEQLDAELRFLCHANRGSEAMPEEDQARVRRIAQRQWTNEKGERQPLLDEDEVANLCIGYGTLTPQERQIINQHMDVTIDMLNSLELPKNLKNVPAYAGAHHEKMDGSGFPLGLVREEIPLPGRMMAVADIFEALTAQDRPYKEPMKLSQALGILQSMRDKNHIDPDIYRLFIQSRVWEAYAKQYLKAEQLDVVDIRDYL